MMLGDEAVIEVSDFRLGSASLRSVRKAVAGPVNAGYRVQVRRQADIPRQELAELIAVADVWRRGGPERGFSMASGRLGNARDARTVIVTAHDCSGRVCGLLSFVPWGRRDLSLDLMRRSPEAISGVTELMVTELIAAADQLGVTQISLNFAMFRESFARGARIGASPLQRLNRKLLVFASRWWQLHSLYQSNEKYRPCSATTAPPSSPRCWQPCCKRKASYQNSRVSFAGVRVPLNSIVLKPPPSLPMPFSHRKRLCSRLFFRGGV